MSMSEAAKEARSKYRKEWYKNNKEKQKKYTNTYWEKRAQEEQTENRVQNESEEKTMGYDANTRTDEAAGLIYKAEAGTEFEMLNGNRNISEKRISKVAKSIEKIGFRIGGAITINKDGQIIDGQARYMACKRLNVPFYYTIDSDAGLAECIEMNAVSTNWNVMDFIESFAAQGNEEYVRLLKYIKKYELSYQVICAVARGNVSEGQANEKLKKGQFEFADIEDSVLDDILSYVKQLHPYAEAIGGTTLQILLAITWLYSSGEADPVRLAKTIKTIANMAESEHIAISTMAQALNIIEERYNRNLNAKRKKYFWTDYRKSMASEYSWYESKHMKKKGNVHKMVGNA